MPIFTMSSDGFSFEEILPGQMDSRRIQGQQWAREANDTIAEYRLGKLQIEAFAHLPRTYGRKNCGDIAEWASGGDGAIVNLLAFIRDCPNEEFDFKFIAGSLGSVWCDMWLPGTINGVELVKFVRISPHGFIGGVLNLLIDGTFTDEFIQQDFRDQGQAYRVYDPVGEDSDEDYGTAPGAGTGAGNGAPAEARDFTPEEVNRALAAATARCIETGMSTMMDINGRTYCIGSPAQIEAMKAFRRANPENFAALASIEHPAGHVDEFLQDIDNGTGLVIDMAAGTSEFVDASEQ